MNQQTVDIFADVFTEYSSTSESNRLVLAVRLESDAQPREMFQFYKQKT